MTGVITVYSFFNRSGRDWMPVWRNRSRAIYKVAALSWDNTEVYSPGVPQQLHILVLHLFLFQQLSLRDSSRWSEILGASFCLKKRNKLLYVAHSKQYSKTPLLTFDSKLRAQYLAKLLRTNPHKSTNYSCCPIFQTFLLFKDA
jgi:hypothetical protein